MLLWFCVALHFLLFACPGKVERVRDSEIEFGGWGLWGGRARWFWRKGWKTVYIYMYVLYVSAALIMLIFAGDCFCCWCLGGNLQGFLFFFCSSWFVVVCLLFFSNCLLRGLRGFGDCKWVSMCGYLCNTCVCVFLFVYLWVMIVWLLVVVVGFGDYQRFRGNY